MLSSVRMARLDAVVLKKYLRGALARLGASGEAELVPAEGAAPAGKGNAELAALSGRLAELRRGLGIKPGAAGAAGQAPDLRPAAGELDRWERRAGALIERRRALAAERSRLAAENARLRPYAGLDLPSAGGGQGLFLYRAAGYIPAEKSPGLRLSPPAGSVLVFLGEEKGLARLAAVAGPDKAGALAAALKAAGFRAEDLPSEPGLSFAALAGRGAQLEAQAAAGLERADREIAALAAEAAGPLAAAERALARETALAAGERAAGGTASSALISAWVPAASAGEAARNLGDSAGGFCAAEINPPRPGDDVPVLLRPPRLLRPFAMLVSAYGLPRYGEVEPTLFAAAAFLLMFGMMFGDAGHGAVVCAGGLWLARRPGNEKLRDGGRLMAACGVSAVFFGLLYGSFFGLERFKQYALWRDPLAGDPLALVAAAAAFGAAVISLGVVLNTVNRARAGDWTGALLGRFGAAGLLVYWSALLWLTGRAAAGRALPLMAAGAVCWVIKEPLSNLLAGRGFGGQEGAAAVAAESAVGAFEGALLYLSNTVSFVRLAAYAMSHAALLTAAYALQGAADGAWGAGSAAGIMAAVLGNAAAIGLEGLVAGVQALRLEYYEFFGKFLEGGGRPFRPFSLESNGG